MTCPPRAVRCRARPRTARLQDSVPPLVKMISCGLTSSKLASLSRASSIAARASRPAACTLDGLPKCRPRYGNITSRAASHSGVVSWGGVDLPLPPPIANGIDFGSDPTLAFDTRGNLFYGYIVVFFGNGSGVKGTEMAVARSTDGGQTYPGVTYFSFESGSNHFNDKPMITADTNATSPFRDNVYIAWEAAAGGSPGGG